MGEEIRNRLLISFFFALFLILFYFFCRPYDIVSKEDLTIHNEKKGKYIEVLGDVKEPGIYTYSGEVTLDDIIKRTGGLKGRFTLDTAPLSARLKSGDSITIERLSKDQGIVFLKRMGPKKLVTLSIPININSATKEELSAVPGIGVMTAFNIIEYRKKNGKFKEMNEMKDVRGIGEVTFNRTKKYLCID
ncbi:MAG: helix-hairpin-helix domain-containing protein [Thermodesulfobacteriota bacterium]|nr:helix-hairpin-helix domain-containing protein [Thermodesulfobacteriota bacterium]